ncbi:MAG: alpha/beta hydrolase [Sphingobacterium sp.]
MAEPIIIGIGYGNAYLMDSLRIRDYTYPKALAQDSFPTSGGANSFYSFLKNELIPTIDRNYRTDKFSRTLMGHSFGGYFTLYVLLQDLETMEADRPLFSNFISASPSINYYNQYIVSKLEKLENHIKKSELKKPGIHVTVGSQELSGELKQLFPKLNELLKRCQTVQSNTKIYKNLDHMGTAIPTFEDAIKNLFQ